MLGGRSMADSDSLSGDSLCVSEGAGTTGHRGRETTNPDEEWCAMDAVRAIKANGRIGWVGRNALPRATARPTFLRWALVAAISAVAFVAAAASYHGHIHAVGKVSVAIVLTVFALATAYSGLLAWRQDDSVDGRVDPRAVEHVALAIRLCPMLAMLGTASGFLIAFTGSTEDVQQRVAGASTGIVATVVGVACTIVLMLQRHLLDEQ